MRSLLAVVVCLTGIMSARAADAPASPPAIPNVDVQWGVKIPLRDGVELNATLYRAYDATVAQPCVFTLTPYISQNYHDRGMYFGANGYSFLTVDARGRGNSGGEFTPLLQEAKDGHDVVEWLAKQPFCNGKITMWGGSYAGYDQWATAKEFPPHLATIVPVASPYAGVDFPMSDNMFYSYDIQWLTLVAGHASQDKLFGDQARWVSVFKRMYLQHRPFRELDRIAGMPSPIFQDWLTHPAPDAYWDAYNPGAAQYAKIDLPILTVTGQYDGDQPGALMHYRQHFANATAQARSKHYLVIGPWDHAGTRTPQAEVGGLTFGPAALVDMNALHKAWYDWTMKNGAKPEFLKAPVMYYVVGSEKWREASSLDAITAQAKPYYLDSTAVGANDVFAAGTLADEKGKGAADKFVYDPLDTTPAEFADDVQVASLTDQRDILLNGGKSLIYHTAPFAHDTEVSGFFKLSAYIAMDQRDADIQVGVFDIAPDGKSVALSGDAIRARYRNNDRVEQLVEPGKIERYDFDSFFFSARVIAKGHRLRLVIAPVNSPSSQKNYNSGGVVSDETAKDARTVTVTLYHDAEHPTALYVPIAAPL